MPLSTRASMALPCGVAAMLVAMAGTVVLATCRGERPAETPGAASRDTTPADSAATVVALHGLPLLVEPTPGGPPVREVAPGTPLRVLESREGWLRVATWDDRRGWVPETETLEVPLWIHYQDALGGAPVSDLRPAYPLTDGRWAVEAPFPSGITPASSIWVEGDPPLVARVASIENVRSTCDGAHRMALLAGRPTDEARVATRRSFLARARLALPGAPAPRLRRLAPRPATPEPAQAQAVAEVANRLVAAARGAGAPPKAFAPAEWVAIGEGVLWVTLAGEPGRAEPEAASWAAAVIVLGEEPGSVVEVVVPPYAAPGQPPALHLVDAFSTPGTDRPSLFLLHRLDYGGQQIDLYVARAGDIRRLYSGYRWGC